MSEIFKNFTQPIATIIASLIVVKVAKAKRNGRNKYLPSFEDRITISNK